MLDDALLVELATFNTPAILNAIETFDRRPHDQGYTDDSIRCLSPRLAPVVGYAVTARVASSSAAERAEHRADFWEHIVSVPAPRFVVIEDVDDPPRRGCYWGEVNANIARALGCRGVLTNGAARDLREMEAAGLVVHAGGVVPSHGYVRLVEVGQQVEVGGLSVRPGDLLHGDVHGVTSIPLDVAPEVPARAREIEAFERTIIAAVRRDGFRVEDLINMGHGVRH